MAAHIRLAGLQVAPVLADFANRELLPKISLSQNAFWTGIASMDKDLTPRNTELLVMRDTLQTRIGAWHKTHRDRPHDAQAYHQFLRDIGY
jgi:malate synthase